MIGRRKKIAKQRATLLLGSYGRGNLGDDVFLVAAAQLFAGHRLYINSAHDDLLPDIAKSLVTTISTTSVRDAWKKVRVFLEVDSIVYWGGDVWVKWYGNRFPRQPLYKMIGLNILARAFGKKVHYVGCGIGKLSGYSLWLARLSARLATTVILREQRSASILNIPGATVLTDLAVNLPFYQPRTHRLPEKGQPFVIGVSLLYHLPDPHRNFPRLIEHVSTFIASLPAGDFRVILLPMLVSKSEKRDDLWASQQLQIRLREAGIACEIYRPQSLQDLIETIGSFDLMIGTRLHANILAAFNATPCLGIAYRPKVSSFFHDNNISEHCIDLEALRDLPKQFWSIYHHYEDVAKRFFAVSSINLEQRVAYQEFADKYE